MGLLEESANEFPFAPEAKESGIKQNYIYLVTLPLYVLLLFFSLFYSVSLHITLE